MYNLCLFDLDGTLTDPKEGITKSVAYALKYFGIQTENLDELNKFIGPPLRDSFCEYYGFSAADAETASCKYRERFAETGIFENKLYPDIPQLLHELKAAGIPLAIATSKPTVFAERIAEHFDLAQYFNLIVGCEFDGTREKKAEVVRYALDALHVSAKNGIRPVMIGDRKHDIIGARENGIDSIGITWGYGSRAELEEAGATWVAESISELQKLILEK